MLDFGGPVLLTPFELVAAHPGSPEYAVIHGRGPFAQPGAPDTEWAELRAGRLTERDYWDRRVAEWIGAGGASTSSTNETTVRDMIEPLYNPPREDLVRPEAVVIIEDARTAGMPVGVLTNDLKAFHSDEWIREMRILGEIDVIVDGSVEGVLKPDPRLYELMSQRLGVGYADMVFVDDQPNNVRGAEALGIPTVAFDVTDPEAGFAAARKLLGLEDAG